MKIPLHIDSRLNAHRLNRFAQAFKNVSTLLVAALNLVSNRIVYVVSQGSNHTKQLTGIVNYVNPSFLLTN